MRTSSSKLITITTTTTYTHTHTHTCTHTASLVLLLLQHSHTQHIKQRTSTTYIVSLVLKSTSVSELHMYMQPTLALGQLVPVVKSQFYRQNICACILHVDMSIFMRQWIQKMSPVLRSLVMVQLLPRLLLHRIFNIHCGNSAVISQVDCCVEVELLKRKNVNVQAKAN